MLIVTLFVSALAGVALGGVFYGLLWATVRRLPGARAPGLLVGSSYLVRLVVLAIGLWLVMAGDWRRLLAAVVGLLVARTLLVNRIAPADKGDVGWSGGE